MEFLIPITLNSSLRNWSLASGFIPKLSEVLKSNLTNHYHLLNSNYVLLLYTLKLVILGNPCEPGVIIPILWLKELRFKQKWSPKSMLLTFTLKCLPPQNKNVYLLILDGWGLMCTNTPHKESVWCEGECRFSFWFLILFLHKSVYCLWILYFISYFFT